MKEILVKIKGLWNGMAPVNSKFANSAYHNLLPLRIINLRTKKEMTISGESLKDLIVQKQGPFPDQFGGEEYNLYYYKWREENENQQKLA